MTEQALQNIRTLIGQARLDQAMTAIKTELPNAADARNQFAGMEAMYAAYKREKNMGLLSFDQENLQRAKLVSNLLDFAKQLYEEAQGFAMAPPPPDIPPGVPAAPSSPTMPPPQAARIKILFLGVNPRGTTQLRIDQELRDIDQALRLSNHRDRFEFIPKMAVTVEDLRRHLLNERPNIIHFSGHGAGQTGLVFEDENGNAFPVPAGPLSRLFGLFQNYVQCVVLNACYSKEQADAIAQSIPYVIGMSDALPDKTAIEFATAFYDTLGSDHSNNYVFAFDIAKTALELKNLPGDQLPVLVKKTT